MQRPTVVVLDTNVLIDNPKAIFGFPDDLLVIPYVVIDELDGLKNSTKPSVRKMARIAANILDEITEANEESETNIFPIKQNGGMLKIEPDDPSIMVGDTNKPDNIIIATALKFVLSESYNSVELYSNDTNVRNKARYHARMYKSGTVFRAKKYSLIASLDDIPSGVTDLTLPDSDVSFLRKEGYLNAKLSYLNGEHLSVRGASNPDMNVALATYDSRQERIILLPDYKKGEPVWRIGGGKEGSTSVRPRDSKQSFMVNDLLDISKDLCFIMSKVAGAGKNFLTTACALRLLKEGHYDRFIMIKPMIAVGGSETGYLPGTKEEKMGPWFESFRDTMRELTNDDQMKLTELEDRIEVDIVTHMRGRSIPRTFMVIDEAQNFTEDDLKTLGSRLGEGSKLVVMGDLSQIDNPRLDSGNTGLRVWAERSRNIDTGYVNSTYILLDNNFRSELSAWFSSFYE